MKKILYVCLFIGFIGPPAFAQGGVVGNLNAQTTDCTVTNSCLILKIDPNAGGATIKLSGTFSATVQFEATADPLTVDPSKAVWVAISATPSNSSTAVSSATSAGVWQVNVAAYQRIRIRVSSYLSGTVAGAINLSTASARGGSGGGGGGGTVASCATFANGDIAFYTAATILGCNDQLQWSTANLRAYTGVPQSTFEPAFQNYNGTNPAKAWLAEEEGTHFINLFVQSEAINGAMDPVYFAVNAHNQQPIAISSDIIGTVDNAQTVALSKQVNLLTAWNGPGTLTTNQDFFSSPNYLNSAQVGTTVGYYGNVVAGDAGTRITNSMDFEADTAAVTNTSNIANDYGFYAANHGGGASTFSAAFFAATQTFSDGHSWAFYNATGKNLIGGAEFVSGTPTISSGFGTGASVTAGTSHTAFRVGVGTSNTGTGVVGLPTAPTGWNCYATNITTKNTNQATILQTASTTATATFQNYTDVMGTHAMTDNDVLAISCFAY